MDPRKKSKRLNITKKNNFHKQRNRKKKRRQNTQARKSTSSLASNKVTQQTRNQTTYKRKNKNQNIHEFFKDKIGKEGFEPSNFFLNF